MEASVDDIADSVQNLIITDAAPQAHQQEPARATRHQPIALLDAIQKLTRSANTTSSRAQAVESLLADAASSGGLPITDLGLICEGTKKLTSITSSLQTTIDALNEATKTSVIVRLKSLGEFRTTLVSKFLSHFDTRIRNIIREVLGSGKDQDALWRIAEECYKQVINPFGTLHTDHFFDPIDESCLELPYDPDFQSEEYYEHENRIQVDEAYAAMFREREERQVEARKKERQSWTDFWVGVLNKVPGGPTLFCPSPYSSARALKLEAVPRYLFRTFDRYSSGRNDESVMASAASIVGSQGSSRIDILELDRHTATKVLHMHLKGQTFTKEPDNLMSWTSSLLFAIQYAIYKREFGGCSSDIRICAVDTRKIPQGQFVQDISLLEAYYDTAEDVGDPTLNFFDFRLRHEDYYNGEYLSQGATNLEDRSCVASLDQLIQAGLFQLYPELEDPKGSRKWADAVLKLRRVWSEEQTTAEWEIHLALHVARKCFAQFESSNIAATLLAFKNRNCSSSKPAGDYPLSWDRSKHLQSLTCSRRFRTATMGTQAGRSSSSLARCRSSRVLQHRAYELFEAAKGLCLTLNIGHTSQSICCRLIHYYLNIPKCSVTAEFLSFPKSCSAMFVESTVNYYSKCFPSEYGK